MKKFILALAVATLASEMPAPVVLMISDLGNGQLQIALPGGAPTVGGVTNVLQSTTDFVTWTSISTNINFNQGFTNIIQATNTMSFYRLYIPK
jgi:hypothetical protein